MSAKQPATTNKQPTTTFGTTTTTAKVETTANLEFVSAVNTRAINAHLTNRYMRQLTNFDTLLSKKITNFLSPKIKLPSNLYQPSIFNFIPEEKLRLYYDRYIGKSKLKKITLIFKIIAFVTLICACLILDAFVFRIWKIMSKTFDLAKASKLKKGRKFRNRAVINEIQ